MLTIIRPAVISLAIACLYIAPVYAATEEEKASFKQVYADYNAAVDRRDLKAALALAEQVLPLGKAVFGEGSKSLAALTHNYGNMLLKNGEPKRALSVLLDVVKLYAKVHDDAALEYVQLYLDLADAERKTDYESNWTKWMDDAIRVGNTSYGSKSADYALLLLDIGHIELVNQGPEGESHIRRGFELLESSAEKPRWAYANFVRAKLDMAHKRYKTALSYLDTCIQGLNAVPPESVDKTMLMTALAFQSVALEETEQSEQATAALQQIGLIKEQLGDTSAEPVFRASPKFPSSIDMTQTGKLIDVERTNEGSVMVTFDVNEKGFTTNHQIEFSVGPSTYIDAALDALKKSRYAPRYVNGQPAPLTGLRFQYRFLINN
jgi:TonB family protein